MSNFVVVLIAMNVTAAFGGRFDRAPWVVVGAVALVADAIALVVSR